MADEIKTTIEIVANLAQVQSQLKTLENDFKTSFGRISALGKDVLGALGVGLSVGGLVVFGKEVVGLGGQLKDLSAQTDFSVKTLSGLKSVIEENGSSLEGFALGIFNAQKNLGKVTSSTDETVKAIEKLGLNFSDLVNSDAETFFKKISGAMAGVKSQLEFNTIGAQIFGRAFRELGPTIRAVGADLNKFNERGLDQATIDKLDEIGDSITRLKNELIIATAPSIATSIKAIAEVLGAIGVAANAITGSTLADFFKTLSAGMVIAAGSAIRLHESLLILLNLPQVIADKASGGIFGKDFFSGPLNKAIEDAEKRRTELARTLRSLRGEFVRKGDEVSGSLSDLAPKDKKPFQFQGDEDKATKSETKAAENFIESIEKEIVKLRERSIELFQGADAAKAFALAEELAIAKNKVLQQLLAEKVPVNIASDAINKAFASIDVEKLTARLRAVRQEIITSAETLVQNPLKFEEWLKTKELDELADKTTKILQRIREAFAEPPTGNLATLTLTAIDKELKNAQEQAQRFASIFDFEFNKAEQDANDLRATIDKLVKDLRLGGDNPIVIKRKIEFENTQVDAVNTALVRAQDEAKTLGKIFGVEFNAAQQEADALRATIERLVRERKFAADNPEIIKLKAEFDDKQVESAVTDLASKIQAAQERARLLPPLQTNVAADTAQARQAEIDRLLNNQSAGARAERERQAGLLAGDRVNAILTDLDNKQQIAAAEAQALGTALDLPRENAAILTEEIKRLIAEGFNPLGPEIQNLKQQLDDAKFGDIIVQGFENAFDILDQLIDGQIKSWRDLGKSIEKVFADVAKEILKTNLKEQLPNLLNQFGIKLPGSTINVPGTQPGGASTGPLTAPSAVPLQANTTATAANTNALITLTQALSAFGNLQQIPRGGSIPGTGQNPQGAVLPPEPVIRETDITGQKSTLGAAIEVQVTEAQTTIDNLGDVAGIAIEAKRDLAGGSIVGLTADALKAIEGESKAGVTALDALKTIAINAITAMGSGGGGGGGGLLGILGGGGGGGGGLLGSIIPQAGNAGSAAGFGTAAAGTEGPSLAGGGFFSTAGGGILDWLGSLFSFAHEGGVVGQTDFPTRSLNIPRYHTGLMPDERVAIVQTGEIIIPRQQAKEMIASGMTNVFTAENFHVSGVVGEASPATNYVHVPFTVPRYHSGLAPDERMGILQVGEAVISREQLRNAKNQSSGHNTIIINNPNFADRTSASQTMQQIGRTVMNAQKRHM